MPEQHEKTIAITWYGEQHQVRIDWTVDKEEIVYIRASLGRKEVVSLYKGNWSTPKKRRFDRSHFDKLKHCCRNNFRFPREYPAALMPVFSIYYGEEL